jgi:hypothetical protein
MSENPLAQLTELARVYEYRLTKTHVLTAAGIELRQRNASCVSSRIPSPRDDNFGLIGVTREWTPTSMHSDWEIRTDCQAGSVIDRVQLRRRLSHFTPAETELVRASLREFGPEQLRD